MSAPGPSDRPFGCEFVPAPTGSEAAAFDRWCIDRCGVPQAVLMENAGRGAAQLLDYLHPEGSVVAVVGSGNNGGDALVALRALAEWGRGVEAIVVGDRADPDPVLHGWPIPRRLDAEIGDEGWASLERASVVVDGVLGTGIQGAPRERQAAAIRRMAACSRPVLALDVPSGVDADDGSVPGDAVHARETVAFGWPKLGTLLQPGRDHVGRLIALDIGLPPAERNRFASRLVTPGWASLLKPTRRPDTHKKAVGVLLIVAGAPGMAGAAVLATRAALRAGAGLVRVASASQNRETLQSATPAAIFIDAADGEAVEAALRDTTAIAAGPGLGVSSWSERVLARILDGPAVTTLLDADALNLAASGRTPPLADLARTRELLITPHPGEMRRLSGDMGGPGRVPAARRWADEVGCCLLLKGSPSLVASPGRPVLLDVMPSSDMATAGLGDVLSGVAGALLCQGLAPADAAALALYGCGRATRRAARGAGLLPDDVVEALPAALAQAGTGETDLPLPGVSFDQDPVR